MRVREESESVAICSPFYSSPEAANVFLQNVCFWHLASFAWSQMFLLTLVKTVPFQLFLLPSNVLFDQASFVPFHLLSHGGKGESFKCSFSTRAVCTFSPLPVGRGGVSNVPYKLGQFVPSRLCLWGRGVLNVPFKPRQIVSFHLCLRGGGGDLHWLSLWGLHNVLIHSFYPLHNLLLLLLNLFLWKSIKYSIFFSFSWTRPESNDLYVIQLPRRFLLYCICISLYPGVYMSSVFTIVSLPSRYESHM